MLASIIRQGIYFAASVLLAGDRTSQLETGVLRKFGAIELILDRTPVSYALHPRNST